MLGFLFGTACLLGLVRVLARGRGCGPWSGHHRCGHGGGPWGHHDDRCGGRRRGHGGFGRRGERFVLRSIFERLDATPGQEKVIAAAAEEVRAALRKHRGELGATRQDLAKAARAEVFDEVLFGELYARQDAAIAELRAAMMGALAKIHAVLEPEQREELGRLIEGGIFRGPWGGPGHDGSHHDGRWS